MPALKYLLSLFPSPHNPVTANNHRLTLFATAIKCLGTDASPSDVAPDEYGCAETVNAIHKRAFGFEIGGTVSTYQLYDALKKSPYFFEVKDPLEGDIVISPTGYGTGALPNGHVGIVGVLPLIMSNSSSTGKFEENYTTSSWRWRYVKQGGYPMKFFRRI